MYLKIIVFFFYFIASAQAETMPFSREFAPIPEKIKSALLEGKWAYAQELIAKYEPKSSSAQWDSEEIYASYAVRHISNELVAGNTEAALEKADSIPWQQYEAYRTIVEYLALNKDFEGALGVIKKVKEDHHKIYLTGRVVDFQILSKKYPGSLRTIGLLSKLDEEYPNSITNADDVAQQKYFALAKSYCRDGNNQKAKKIMLERHAAQGDPQRWFRRDFLKVVEFLVEIGSDDLAQATALQAWDVALNSDLPVTGAKAQRLKEAAECLALAGLNEERLTALQQAAEYLKRAN